MRLGPMLAFSLGFIFASSVAVGMTPKACLDLARAYGGQPTGCALDVPTLRHSPIGDESPQGKVSDYQKENHVFFPRGGTSLDAVAVAQIDLLSELLSGETLGNACIALVGHSDTSGGELANYQVALRRAETVGAAIKGQLLDPERVKLVISAGETLPLPNLTDRNRWQRRVEIRAQDCSN